MIRQRFERENIALAGDPTFFFINNITTFRRLFSRQMSESEIEKVVSDESQPTLTRPGVPDPTLSPPPANAESASPAPAGATGETERREPSPRQ
jgi:hypothetical protein